MGYFAMNKIFIVFKMNILFVHTIILLFKA